MTAEREALQRIRLVVDREDISCFGRIVVVKTFLDQALANPATIRDTDEGAEKAWRQAVHLYRGSFNRWPPRTYDADLTTVKAIVAAAPTETPAVEPIPGTGRMSSPSMRPTASSPAEPREASGYCPYCMTADPVAPAEGDAPGERKC